MNTIALAKPDKAKMVENMLIQMAQSGQIGGKVGQNQKIYFLKITTVQKRGISIISMSISVPKAL